MDEPSVFLRIIMGLELLAFLVVLGCCSTGIRRTQARMFKILAELDKTSSQKHRWWVRDPAERARRRKYMGPILKEIYFWGFFLVFGCALFWTFIETLPV